MKKQIFITIAVIVLGVAIFFSSADFKDFFSTKSTIEPAIKQGADQTKQTTETAVQTFAATTGKVSIKVPAVDNEGNGVATVLTVQAIPGEGRTLTNINQLLFWVDTQYSIQIAKYVAENITNVNTSKVDLIYTIETDATVIEGPSAGAALTAATIAVLQNKSVDPEVSVTGTINADGSIGPVGGILEKAKASKDVGIKTFLVPEGQGTQTSYTPEKDCEQFGGFTYCTTEYKRQRINITAESGIEIVEVSNIEEALKYFLV